MFSAINASSPTAMAMATIAALRWRFLDSWDFGSLSDSGVSFSFTTNLRTRVDRRQPGAFATIRLRSNRNQEVRACCGRSVRMSPAWSSWALRILSRSHQAARQPRWLRAEGRAMLWQAQRIAHSPAVLLAGCFEWLGTTPGAAQRPAQSDFAHHRAHCPRSSRQRRPPLRR